MNPIDNRLADTNWPTFPDDIFICISSMKMYDFRSKFHWSLFPSVQSTISQHLVHIMAWRRSYDKPLSKLMMVNSLTYIYIYIYMYASLDLNDLRLSWTNQASMWWRHQMEAFSASLAFCASQRPVTRSFDVFFDVGLNKQLSKQSWGCWFETPSR